MLSHFQETRGTSLLSPGQPAEVTAFQELPKGWQSCCSLGLPFPHLPEGCPSLPATSALPCGCVVVYNLWCFFRAVGAQGMVPSSQMVFAHRSHHLLFLVDEVPLFCCVSPGRMFSGIEVDFSASFPLASSLQVLLAAHLFFWPSGFFTDEFVHLFSGCFNVLCLSGGLATQPTLRFFLPSCYIDFVPTA